MRRSRWRHAAALALYLGLAGTVFARDWAHLDHRVQGGSDAYLFAWFLRWTPYALGHGLNPWITHSIAIPHGANVLWNTSVPLLAVLVAPITLTAGPIAAFNTLMTLGLALSGWTMYLVARRWVGGAAALLAGTVYGFGPPMIGAAIGHLHLAFAVFPPLALALLDDLLVRRRPPVRTGALLGLAAAAQFLIGSEMLTTTAIVAALGVALLALEHRHQVRAVLRPALAGFGTAAAITGVLLAEPLAFLFFGEQRVTGFVQPPGVAVSDLVTYVVPGPLQHFAPTAALRISSKHTSNAAEVVNYLGIPLLLLLAVIVVRRWSHPLVRLLAPLGAVVSLLSLGPWLHIEGHQTFLDLPWRALQFMPITKNILPARLSLFVIACVALMLAVELQALLRAGRRRAWLGGAAITVALLPLVPQIPLGAATVPVPSFFTTSAAHVLRPGSVVLVAPYPRAAHAIAMEWQAEAGLRFRMPGGYVLLPGPNGRVFNPPDTPLTAQLTALEFGRTTPDRAAAAPGVLPALAALHPESVVLGPCRHRPALLAFLTRILGSQPRDVGGVQLWTLRR